jgi:hypothetical protein
MDIEVRETKEQNPGDKEIQKCPHDVNACGRNTPAGRFGKGSLKGAARDAVHQMRHRIGEECSAKEECNQGVPMHRNLPSVSLGARTTNSNAKYRIIAEKHE